ncbi:DUF1788 domain-containing protein [Thermomonas aquatica]|uniref:DUF1788 domain-containing protein n=1 Tax=Thermomonas aquatica TaxID=2202149 RepID=A0A5B7ZP61_9GAMM|nr:DUF1788 domain-containing protein [Thermomonas aquatica]QDA56984.1 DUF1788 domain-containing protein [Thermomonas aquatica]
MTDDFRVRLNKIADRLSSDDLLTNKGLGNEIGFWIFDYPPEREMEVRTFIDSVLLPGMSKRQPAVRVAVANLFALIIEMLEDRNLYKRVIDIQAKKGDAEALEALRPILKEDKFAERIASRIDFDQMDVLLLTGVGAAYPMLRSHTLLSALQATMKDKPLVMFYPGRYDGFSLRLFNKLDDDNYYRAFRLVE